jgi:S1-C subfamily serine protease
MATLAATPALAIVGGESGGAREAHSVMVLKRAGRAAGFCSGVVLSDRLVLTAAHCVADASETRVHFRDAQGGPVLIGVDRISVHPLYRAGAERTRERSVDLAILRTTNALPSRFSPASLSARGAVQTGERVVVAGYGVTRENAAETSGVFRAAALAVRAPLSSLLVWAEGANGVAAGACTGDSGGPMLEASGAVIAVTAWSAGQGRRGCGGLTQGILVAPQRGWIDRVSAEMTR